MCGSQTPEGAGFPTGTERTRLLAGRWRPSSEEALAKQGVAGIEKSIRDMEAAVETKRAYIGKMKGPSVNTRKNENTDSIQEVEKGELLWTLWKPQSWKLMERLETLKTDLEQKNPPCRDAQRELEETLARLTRTAETDKGS